MVVAVEERARQRDRALPGRIGEVEVPLDEQPLHRRVTRRRLERPDLPGASDALRCGCSPGIGLLRLRRHLPVEHLLFLVVLAEQRRDVDTDHDLRLVAHRRRGNPDHHRHWHEVGLGPDPDIQSLFLRPAVDPGSAQQRQAVPTGVVADDARAHPLCQLAALDVGRSLEPERPPLQLAFHRQAEHVARDLAVESVGVVEQVLAEPRRVVAEVHGQLGERLEVHVVRPGQVEVEVALLPLYRTGHRCALVVVADPDARGAGLVSHLD